MSRRDIKVLFSAREMLAITGALRVAREEYLKHAGADRAVEAAFKAQATDCSDLIERLEDLEA